MNIVLTVHHSLVWDSGAAGTTLSLAHEYEQRGHRVEVYSFDDLPPRLSARQKLALFPVFVARRLASMARSGVDVVDCSTGDGWLWSLWRRRDSRPLFVTRSHGIEHLKDQEVRDAAARGELQLSWKYPLYSGGFHLREVSISLRRADLALFLNESERDFAVRALGINARVAFVSPNGLPASLVGLDITSTPPQDEAIGIALIGTYLRRKGIAYARQALQDVLTGRPQARATFLGTAIATERVLADFEPNLHRRIRVIEHYKQPELPALLSACQIKLFPSLFEGFGKALLEGMACGLAPVTTDVPGPRDLVRDGETGLVVPPRDAAALRTALLRLIDDRALLSRLRVAAHRAAQPFTWPRIAEQRLALYEQALMRSRRSA